jgi:DNA-binding NarL/FixJ family response regulator
MKELHVLVADDRALVRAGIRSLLQSLEGVQVIAEASDGREALNLIRELHPDLVMMDISMPGMNGLEALRRVREEFRDIKVVILSMHADQDYIIQALMAGAAGYLLKDSPYDELERCLRTVERGETYFSPRLPKSAISEFKRRARGRMPKTGLEGSSFQRLSPREREVLQLIAEGHSTRDIARIMGISVKTADTHRTSLMKRLDIHDVAGLTRYAIQKGLVKPDDMT